MLNKQCIWKGKGIFLSIVTLMSLHCFGAEEQKIFCGESIELLDRAYNEAPFQVRRTINRMITQKRSVQPSNYAILHGDPGVGKTTLALAIAYKLGWETQRINASDLMQAKSSPNTTIALHNRLSAIEEIKDNQIIIFDDLDHIFLDNDPTTRGFVISTFLDNIRPKRNLFFIGITNNLNCFPSRLAHRVIPYVVIMPDHSSEEL